MSKEKLKYHNSTKLWAAHTSTVLSTSFALFLLGFFIIISFSTFKFSNQIKESIGFKINLLSNTPDDVAIAFCDTISKFNYVKSVEYVSKEEAAKLFIKELGEDFVSLIGENPLYPTIIVNLKSHRIDDNMNHIDAFVENVAKNEYVTDVEYDKDIVNELYTIIKKVAYVLLGLVILLFFISITMINNTIRISLYSKRFIIRTMLLVGAKKSFIIKPFITKSIQYGFLGGLITIISLGSIIYYVNSTYHGLFNLEMDWPVYTIAGLSLIALGVLISFLSTYFTIIKHINTKHHKLY